MANEQVTIKTDVQLVNTPDKILLFIILISSLLACVFLSACSQTVYRYGEKIRYIDYQVNKLPDISVLFLGSITEYPDCTTHEFEVTQGKEQKGVSWCSKSDDVQPRYFEIGGQEYVLEVGGTFVEQPANEEKMGWHEMIVWQKEEYERKRKNERQK